MEVSDAQAAVALFGLTEYLCSEIFSVYDSNNKLKFALDEKEAKIYEDDDLSNTISSCSSIDEDE